MRSGRSSSVGGQVPTSKERSRTDAGNFAARGAWDPSCSTRATPSGTKKPGSPTTIAGGQRPGLSQSEAGDQPAAGPVNVYVNVA